MHYSRLDFLLLLLLLPLNLHFSMIINKHSQTPLDVPETRSRYSINWLFHNESVNCVYSDTIDHLIALPFLSIDHPLDWINQLHCHTLLPVMMVEPKQSRYRIWDYVTANGAHKPRTTTTSASENRFDVKRIVHSSLPFRTSGVQDSTKESKRKELNYWYPSWIAGPSHSASTLTTFLSNYRREFCWLRN